MNKVWYMYTMEYYPAIKVNEIISFSATQMDLNNKCNNPGREKHMILYLYVEYKN